MSRSIRCALIVLAVLMVVPAAALAQASIAGTVKDSSGAVLPGVTVEASSPALIEKTRSVVTDGSGLYTIVDLRPGMYTVTFTLTGFNTVKREGLELSGSFTAAVNAEMRVGALEETITVTGETPVVDLRSASRERVMTTETIATLPTSRVYASLTVLTPGITGTGAQDVGGTTGGSMSDMLAHGSKFDSQRITQNGLTLAVNTGFKAPAQPNMLAFEEVTINLGSVDSSTATGGVRINLIPREGGNTFRGLGFLSFANSSMQGNNFDEELKSLGLSTPNKVKRLWDVNPGFGGPIRQDKLWFFTTVRHLGAYNYVAGVFYNANELKPDEWTYVPDRNRPAVNQEIFTDAQARFTWQATPRNKVAMSYQQDEINHNRPFGCNCIRVQGGLTAPEAAVGYRFPLERMMQADWTSPVTSKLLMEAAVLQHSEWWGTDDAGAAIVKDHSIVSVTEQGGPIAGLTYRAPAQYGKQFMWVLVYRAAVSYVTGAHTFKVGFNDGTAYTDVQVLLHQPFSYRFNNGVPNQLTLRTPSRLKTEYDHDLGLYAQDRWTMNRLTLTYGLRFDYFSNTIPENRLGPATLAPARNLTFPEQDNLSFKDLTPKVTAVYDVFGTGKTALKVSLNKYLAGLINMTATTGQNSLVFGPSRVNDVVSNTTRGWTDTNRNYVADCNLIDPLANGECAAMANRAFGTLGPGATWDPKVLTGWGNRHYNWEFSTGVQQEIIPRVSADVSYFRRWYGNFLVTDNLAVEAADFDTFGITAPSNPRLPEGGGYVISGLYDLNPRKFGVPSQIYNTLSDTFGKQIEHWNGADVTVNARLQSGLLLQGGISSGRTTTDNCEIAAKLPEVMISGSALRPLQHCHIQTKFLTQGKFLGAYTVPKIDLLVSATLQSLPEPVTSNNTETAYPSVAANFVVSNAVARASLGRDLSAGANQNVTVNLIQPGTLMGKRLNQVDMRVGRVFQFGRTRATAALDLYNATNANAVLTENSNYASFRQPLSIVQPRLAKVSLSWSF